MKRPLIGVVALVCVALAGCSQGYFAKFFAQACDAGTFEGAFADEEVVAQNWTCR